MSKRFLSQIVILLTIFILISCSNNQNKENSLSLNQKLENEGAAFKILKLDKNKTCIPSNPSTSYSYYEAEEGNTFLDIHIELENISNHKKDLDDILQIYVVYNGEEFSSFPTIEPDDGSDIVNANFYTIESEGRYTFRYLAQVPEDINNYSLRVKLNSKDYILNNL